MAKKVKTAFKLQIRAGKASPAPPVGPTLGQHGIDIGQFVSRFNEATAQMGGDMIPVVVTVYEDRSFDMVFKTPPAADLLRQAAKIEKGSGEPHKVKVGSVTKDQVRQIAERKMEDLSAHDTDQAMKIIAGTARSMGIDVK